MFDVGILELPVHVLAEHAEEDDLEGFPVVGEFFRDGHGLGVERHRLDSIDPVERVHQRLVAVTNVVVEAVVSVVSVVFRLVAIGARTAGKCTVELSTGDDVREVVETDLLVGNLFNANAIQVHCSLLG